MPNLSVRPKIEVLHCGEIDFTGPLDEATINAVADAFAEHKIPWVKIGDNQFLRIADWCEEQRAVLHPLLTTKAGGLT